MRPFVGGGRSILERIGLNGRAGRRRKARRRERLELGLVKAGLHALLF